MQAKVGDRLVVKSHHVGEPDRDCEVLEVHGRRPSLFRALGRDGARGPLLPRLRRRR